MNEKEKIQAVINRLQEVMIPATYDNVNRILRLVITGETEDEKGGSGCSGNCSGCSGCR